MLVLEKIGVEQSLSNISAALREKGYDVVDLKQEHDAQGCDCYVNSGIDIQDTITQGPVIEASA